MNATSKNITFIITCHILSNKVELVKNFPSGTGNVVHIITLVSCICQFLSTIFLSAVTVATIWTSRSLSEKVSFFTIMLQSCVDLAIGVTIFPMFIAHLACEISGSPNCVLVYALKVVSGLFYLYSMASLSMLNFERYMGVLHPFVHRAQVTKARILKVFFIVCALQTIIGALTLTHLRELRYFIGATTILLIAMTVFIYTRICCSRCKNVNYPDLGERRISQITENTSESIRFYRRLRFKRELKLAKTCFLVVLCFLVCNLVVIDLMFGIFEVNDVYFEAMHKRWGFMLMFSSSTFNSLVYFWQNEALRHEAKAFIRRQWVNPGPHHPNHPNTYPKHMTHRPFSQSQPSLGPYHDTVRRLSSRPDLILNSNELDHNRNLNSIPTPGKNLNLYQLPNSLALVYGRDG